MLAVTAGMFHDITTDTLAQEILAGSLVVVDHATIRSIEGNEPCHLAGIIVGHGMDTTQTLEGLGQVHDSGFLAWGIGVLYYGLHRESTLRIHRIAAATDIHTIAILENFLFCDFPEGVAGFAIERLGSLVDGGVTIEASADAATASIQTGLDGVRHGVSSVEDRTNSTF